MRCKHSGFTAISSQTVYIFSVGLLSLPSTQWNPCPFCRLLRKILPREAGDPSLLPVSVLAAACPSLASRSPLVSPLLAQYWCPPGAGGGASWSSPARAPPEGDAMLPASTQGASTLSYFNSSICCHVLAEGELESRSLTLSTTDAF